MSDKQQSFNWLSQLDQNVVAAIQAKMQIKNYCAGSTIYYYDQQADNMYQILSGEVQANHVDSEGREILYHIMVPGDCFGEVAVIDDAPRAQTTVARVDSQLAVLKRKDYERLSAQYPSINQVLLKQQCQRLRMAFGLLETASIGNLRQKLLKRLQSLAELHGEELCSDAIQRGRRLTITLSQEELGRMLGVSRQSINRELGALQKQGCLLVEDGYIVLFDTDTTENNL